MNFQILKYIGIAIAVIGIAYGVYHFIDTNAYNRGVADTENRVISHKDTSETIILYDTVLIDKIRLVPHVRVEKETVFNEVVNVARQYYTFDSTLDVGFTAQIDSETQNLKSKISVSGRISTYPKLSFDKLKLTHEPLSITTIRQTTVYEKPVPYRPFFGGVYIGGSTTKLWDRDDYIWSVEAGAMFQPKNLELDLIPIGYDNLSKSVQSKINVRYFPWQTN